MPWFWGRKTEEDDDDDESSSAYEDEEYTDEEEEDEADNIDNNVVVANEAAVVAERATVLEATTQTSSATSDPPAPTRTQPPPKPDEDGGESSSSSSSSLSHASQSVEYLVADAADAGKRTEGEHRNGSSNHGGGGKRKTAATSESGSSRSSSSSSSSTEDEQLLKGVIPNAVDVLGGGPSSSGAHQSRFRADSALSYGSAGEDVDDDEGDDHSSQSSAAKAPPPRIAASASGDDDDDDNTAKDNIENGHGTDPAEDVTSAAEKRSLLVLAAEHDRVDILQAILGEEERLQSGDGGEGAAVAATDRAARRDDLLHGGVPPLHIAASHGSINATNFLLRKGADPSVRPTSAALAGAESVDVPNRNRFESVSAWELVFGYGDENDSWHGANPTPPPRPPRRRNFRPVDLPPSKREGIRHAFTAEALRCIGSDEVDRLRQLLESGVPPTIDLGGRDLHAWCVEMGAARCAALLRPNQQPEDAPDGQVHPPSATPGSLEKRESRVLDRGGEPDTPTQLWNRLDELESLGRALSVSLDGLAEEVSVCNGLLLMGGGASALASHVRGLKATKESKLQELERMQDAWENSEDELAYWAREGGPDAHRIATDAVVELPDPATAIRRQTSLTATATSSNPAEAEAQRKQLLAQVAASEQKIRKLRASIADLSEVCARDLAEVERRGLSGGITLVRGLREELREIEFQLSEAKNGDATCRTKIRMIQTKLQAARAPGDPVANGCKDAAAPKGAAKSGKLNESSPLWSDEVPVTVDPLAPPIEPPFVAATQVTAVGASASSSESGVDPGTAESQRIAAGQSTAIAVRHGGDQGFFPLSLWQILLRIIGFGDDAPSSSRRSATGHSQVLLI